MLHLIGKRSEPPGALPVRNNKNSHELSLTIARGCFYCFKFRELFSCADLIVNLQSPFYGAHYSVNLVQ